MAAAVEAIAAGAGSAGDKVAGFQGLFDTESAKYLADGDAAALGVLTALGQHLTEASFQVSRPVLQHAAAALKGTPVSDHLVKLAETLMGQLKSRQSSFLVSDYLLREALHAAYINANSFAQAASVLAQMDIEAAAKAVSLPDSQRFLIYVRIAQAYMKGGDDYHADEYTRKANAEGILDCGDPLVELQYLVCLGFVQDARRSFAQAANCFHRVSTMQHESLASAELEVLLQKASVCAVLSPPGPSRTRMLDVVMRDPRSVLLPTFSMLAKMHKGHFITPPDISAFCALLKDDPAKLATDAEGLNDVQKAARLHNLAAVARVYRNISFASLGSLLGVGEEEAEDLAARMIQEDRMAGVIDQASGTLEFAKSADPLHTWDRRLTASTAQLGAVSERIAAKHPSIAEAAVAGAGASDPTGAAAGQGAAR